MIDRPASEVVAAGGRFPLAWEEAEVRSWTLSASGQGGSNAGSFKTLWRDDSGQDTAEYVLLVLLVALAVTAGMLLLATENNADAPHARGQERR